MKKKILALAIGCVTLLGAVACGNKVEDTTPSDNQGGAQTGTGTDDQTGTGTGTDDANENTSDNEE